RQARGHLSGSAGRTVRRFTRSQGYLIGTIHRSSGFLAESGGIRPAERRRSRWALALTEREEISRAVVAGRSIRSIAASLRRAPSTIGREIRRKGGAGGYRASRADQAAWDRARRPKVCRLVENPDPASFRRTPGIRMNEVYERNRNGQ